jgi:hypothetical protein
MELATATLSAVLLADQYSPSWTRTLGAVLAHYGQPVTLPVIAQTAGLKLRTVQRHVAQLRAAGLLAATGTKRNLVLTLAANSTRPAASPTAAPASAPGTDAAADALLPSFLQTDTLPAGVTRPYTAEFALLDSIPALAGKIKPSWLAYLERKWTPQFAAAQPPTDLRTLVDSFVHEFLKNGRAAVNSLAGKRLRDARTDWESALQTHIAYQLGAIRRGPPAAAAKPKPAAVTTPSLPFTPNQPTRQRRASASAVPVPSVATLPAAADAPTTRLVTSQQSAVRNTTGPSSLAAAALANPILGKLVATHG